MAARKWTQEQKQLQAELIQTWSPWSESTGPTSRAGKLVASRNALKGSVRPRLRQLAKEIADLLKAQSEFFG